ncbi:MAG TPA: cytochrome P450 [Gemmataceae bacterium]|jgi:cytochrome P450 PksS
MGLIARLTGRPAGDGGPDIASPAHKADPFPFYARLRAESPVHHVTLRGGMSVWLVVRYDDVVAILRDERFAKDRLSALTPDQIRKQPWIPPTFRPLTRNMLDLDPPDHDRLRALVQKAFTPRLVEGLRPRVQALADGLLDGLRGRPGFDLIRDYALPIPTTVIAEMLGVPAADRHRFQRWSKAIVATDPSGLGMLLVVPHVWRFLRYIRRLIRAKRAAPAGDLLTALIQAEEAGDRLTEDELLAMTFLLLVAGHETTVNLIGNGTLALLEHPHQLDRLRRDPGLIKPAVEELLRYASPLETATERFTREDVTVAGVTIPRGAMVFAAIASANRDSGQFPDPNALDVGREPNKHLSFGLGPHYCLGAPLARLEGQVAIATLLRRVPQLRSAVTPTALRWRRGLVLRGLESLPVLIDRWA